MSKCTRQVQADIRDGVFEYEDASAEQRAAVAALQWQARDPVCDDPSCSCHRARLDAVRELGTPVERPFRCSECGTLVTHAYPRPDVLWRMDEDRLVPLPMSVPVPSCSACEEYFVTAKLSLRIDTELSQHSMTSMRALARALCRSDDYETWCRGARMLEALATEREAWDAFLALGLAVATVAHAELIVLAKHGYSLEAEISEGVGYAAIYWPACGAEPEHTSIVFRSWETWKSHKVACIPGHYSDTAAVVVAWLMELSR